MREAAERLGVSHTSVSRWENENIVPRRESLLLIQKHFPEVDWTPYMNENFNSGRKLRRLEGRIWSMKAEQNVVQIYPIGEHEVELLKDGSLLINARTVVLAERRS